jgi:hypothetical protein
MRPLALFLIIVGAIGLVWGGVSYIKDRDTAKLGPVEVTITDKDRISIPPVAGTACLIGGLVLFVASSRRRSDTHA